MYQLCFPSGLTSEQWAAWVQAIGSIAAIIAAIWIASRQHRIAVSEAKRERAERAARTARLCTTFGDQVVEGIKDMAEACAGQSRKFVGLALSRLREAVEYSRSVDVNALPPDAIQPFLFLRIFAAHAISNGEPIVASPMLQFRQAEQDFDAIGEDASGMNLILAAAFGDESARREIKEEEKALAEMQPTK